MTTFPARYDTLMRVTCFRSAATVQMPMRFGRFDRISALFGVHPSADGATDMTGALPPSVEKAVSEEVAGRLRASQVDAVSRLRTPLMVVNIVNALALLWVMEAKDQVPATTLPWLGLVCSIALWSLILLRLKGRRPKPVSTSLRAVRRIQRNAAIFGLVWAIPGLTFFPVLDGFPLAFAMALLTGMIAGGAFALYPIPAAAVWFMLPVTVGGVAGLIVAHGWMATAPALLAAMFLLIFIAGVKRHAEIFVADFLIRLEIEKRTRLIEDLLEDARLELIGSARINEERLAQAKKMEVIGLLTSGIAHDFNNLLTVVRGSAELLDREGQVDPTLVADIVAASDRGAKQVQRLLSVAQQQRLQPETVDLAALLKDLSRVLEPSLGPSHPIRIELAPQTPSPHVDPAQLENGLVNLVFNARDAMPDGGTIRIGATRDPADPARIAVSVSDTGIGMDADTQARATDPFFTTKKFGQGNGLGLSSVAGFTRQSGGELRIQSAPGTGTTVTMLLPVRGDDTTDNHPGSRTVLVVEDSPDVRDVTARMLRDLGHDVQAVASAEEAMERLRHGPHVDLVLTDILLSDSKTGLQLAREIRLLRQDLPVLFMSAWSEGRWGIRGTTTPLLRKPFSSSELAAQVETALAGEKAAMPVT